MKQQPRASFHDFAVSLSPARTGLIATCRSRTMTYMAGRTAAGLESVLAAPAQYPGHIAGNGPQISRVTGTQLVLDGASVATGCPAVRRSTRAFPRCRCVLRWLGGATRSGLGPRTGGAGSYQIGNCPGELVASVIPGRWSPTRSAAGEYRLPSGSFPTRPSAAAQTSSHRSLRRWRLRYL